MFSYFDRKLEFNSETVGNTIKDLSLPVEAVGERFLLNSYQAVPIPEPTLWGQLLVWLGLRPKKWSITFSLLKDDELELPPGQPYFIKYWRELNGEKVCDEYTVFAGWFEDQDTCSEWADEFTDLVTNDESDNALETTHWEYCVPDTGWLENSLINCEHSLNDYLLEHQLFRSMLRESILLRLRSLDRE